MELAPRHDESIQQDRNVKISGWRHIQPEEVSQDIQSRVYRLGTSLPGSPYLEAFFVGRHGSRERLQDRITASRRDRTPHGPTPHWHGGRLPHRGGLASARAGKRGSTRDGSVAPRSEIVPTWSETRIGNSEELPVLHRGPLQSASSCCMFSSLQKYELGRKDRELRSGIEAKGLLASVALAFEAEDHLSF